MQGHLSTKNIVAHKNIKIHSRKRQRNHVKKTRIPYNCWNYHKENLKQL